MSILSDGWSGGSWNNQLSAFRTLARIIGFDMPNPTLDDLQEMYVLVANKKVFAEAIDTFMEEATKHGRKKKNVKDALFEVDRRLGLSRPVRFRSLIKGSHETNPCDFKGTAIWPAGTVSFMHLRREMIRLAQRSGAQFDRIIVLGSSRPCGSPDDRRHPFIRSVFEPGREPSEIEVLKLWLYDEEGLDPRYIFPELPENNESGKWLSLEEQLAELVSSFWFQDNLGEDWREQQFFVPANPNALYVPLHVRRVLRLDDVWFSQAGAELQDPMPSEWWQTDQNLMTTPSGIIRLWKELRSGGFINENAS